MRMKATTRIGTLAALAAAGLAGCYDITLEPSEVPSSVRIEPSELYIEEGTSGKVRVVVLDQNDREMASPPTWAPPRWNLDPSAVTVHPDGTVEGHKGGFNKVLALIAGTSAAGTIKVQPNDVALGVQALYLNQAAQNLGNEVPIIAGRPGLLRAFVVGDEGSFYEPTVRATLFLDDEEVYSVTMAPENEYLPPRAEEGRLDLSYNAVIDGEHIQPGLEIVLDMDVHGVVPLKAGSSKRWPETGREQMDVRSLPTMKLMVVPTVLSWNPDGDGAVGWSRTISETSANTRLTRTLRPVGDFEITVRETFVSEQDLRTGNGWSRYLNEIRLLREVEDHNGYYYGAVQLPPGSAWGGLGFVGFPAGVGRNHDNTMAHEVGHNMNLRHAPCGGAGGPDPAYPNNNGDIGIWGYNVEGRRLMGPSDFKDDMSYCDPTWVSDYHFLRAMDYRLANEPFSGDAPPDAAAMAILYISGAMDANGVDLFPAYVIEARASLPGGSGPYLLQGLAADGSTLFSHAFTPDPTEFGGSQFAFGLPYEDAWRDALDRIVVSGPTGQAALSHNSQTPTAIVRNPATGAIVAITSDFAVLENGGGVLYALSAGLPVTQGPAN